MKTLLKIAKSRPIILALAGLAFSPALSTLALARVGNESALEARNVRSSTRADFANWQIGQSIVLRHHVELPLVEARDARGVSVKPTKALLLATGSEMSVLRMFSNSDGEPMIEFGLDFDGEVDSEGQPLYTQITVQADSLVSGRPEPVTSGISLIGATESLSPIDDQISVAVNSDEVDVAVETARRGGRVAVRKGKVPGQRRKGMTYCYRNVKNYLMQKCGFPIYLPGESAISSVEILPRFGFNRISENFDGFESMPVCTVCVLDGGTHICSNGKPCGDIAVKTVDGKGWYAWKLRETPHLAGRTPVGCFYRTPGTPIPVNPEIGGEQAPVVTPTPQAEPASPPTPSPVPANVSPTPN